MIQHVRIRSSMALKSFDFVGKTPREDDQPLDYSVPGASSRETGIKKKKSERPVVATRGRTLSMERMWRVPPERTRWVLTGAIPVLSPRPTLILRPRRKIERKCFRQKRDKASRPASYPSAAKWVQPSSKTCPFLARRTASLAPTPRTGEAFLSTPDRVLAPSSYSYGGGGGSCDLRRLLGGRDLGDQGPGHDRIWCRGDRGRGVSM